jgi:hypothetical protein
LDAKEYMATRSATEQLNETGSAREIEVPAPTAWPFILAIGVALLFAGLVTSPSVSCLGALLTLAGSVGWFREVLPREHEEVVVIVPEDIRLMTTRRLVDRLPILPDQFRAWLPVRTYSIWAGVKGGFAGSIAMAILACAYGILKVGSVWYPINLLAAVAYRESQRLVPAQLNSFHADAFAIAFVLHGIVSIFVGLLYGAMLPMFPRRPIVLGGFIAPALWSGVLYTILGLLNPLLASHIDWPWFMASQVAFGIVAGLVVVRQPSFPTRENVSFVIRAGIQAPGTIPPRESGENRR